MRQLQTIIQRVLVDTDGQDLLEYGFLMALIAIVAITAVQNVGNTVNAVLWQTIVQNF